MRANNRVPRHAQDNADRVGERVAGAETSPRPVPYDRNRGLLARTPYQGESASDIQRLWPFLPWLYRAGHVTSPINMTRAHMLQAMRSLWAH